MRLLKIFRSKLFVASAATLLLFGGSFGAYEAYLQLSGNFHTVIPGELYRSAQPTSAALESYVREHGIKTVLNLRGSTDAKWYKQELADAQRLGVEHIDFRMSAARVLSREQADRLIEIMRSAPKPMLIHCQSGADRTGLVSLIYSHQIAHIDEDTAERQLSFLYGHVAIPHFSRTYAMDRSWADLEKYYNVEPVVGANPASGPRDTGAEVHVVEGTSG
ncbi:dual specificity protein phosphatase family protein [Rhizobium sp. S96]|uniref:dual specificity protein phosphatase family protein n=1 Tax=Rhizobium sp. S96 TaxID=3055140 RepID=UPI0025AAAA8A|nr:dual specificity protein phosphatase family protein [Rhizobium sp. S96]MDM9620861.1 dual specificity protein phosphatase family protein [Rhizobium sp. S96]